MTPPALSLILLSFLLALHPGSGNVLQTARVLEDELFAQYRKWHKPRTNQSEPVLVTYMAYLQQLVEVNVETQTVTIVFWKLQKWRDEFLTWNPRDYHDIDTIHINPVQIWLPDVIINNKKDYTDMLEEVTQIPAKIQHDGNVTWFKPSYVTVDCDMNVKHFPWDSQACKVAIGSWTQTSDDIGLIPTDIRKSSNYIEHHEWKLFETSSSYDVVVVTLDGEEKLFPLIEYHLIFARKSKFYVIVIVVPTIIISLVSMTVFILPNDSNEKITFSMSMMLSFYINLLVVAGNIPNSSEHYPYIGTYYLVCIFLISASLLQTTLTLNLHFKQVGDTPRAPLWLRKLCLGNLGRLVVLPMFRTCTWAKYSQEVADTDRHNEKRKQILLNNRYQYKRGGGRKKKSLNTNNSIEWTRIADRVEKLDDYLGQMDLMTEEKTYNRKIITEWQLIAKVIDIVIGLVFLCVAVSLCLYFVTMARSFSTNFTFETQFRNGTMQAAVLQHTT